MNRFLVWAKPTILKIHRWIGLGLGAVFIMQGITGTIVAFRPEL
ncbi:MAG: PepSY domain-containing protein, partial [Rhodospirillaceae bacterium]|nr:PepSY domain-containing protein [Rhodospirillaceae bacterium]